MNSYTVEYKMHSNGEVKRIQVLAKSKVDAYDKAVYEDILKKEGAMCYSAWVFSKTFQNGNYQRFKTHEGVPY